MKIAKGLDLLELKTEGIGGPSVFCPTLIWDEETVILVDTGISHTLTNIELICKVI